MPCENAISGWFAVMTTVALPTGVRKMFGGSPKGSGCNRPNDVSRLPFQLKRRSSDVCIMTPPSSERAWWSESRSTLPSDWTAPPP